MEEKIKKYDRLIKKNKHLSGQLVINNSAFSFTYNPNHPLYGSVRFFRLFHFHVLFFN